MKSIIITYFAISICYKSKEKPPFLVRRQFPAKISHPCIHPAVSADSAASLHLFKIFLLIGDLYFDFDIGTRFIKVFLLYLIVASYSSYCIKNCCFSCIVLPHQNQSIFNIFQHNFPDRFKMADFQSDDPHAAHLRLTYSSFILSVPISICNKNAK